MTDGATGSTPLGSRTGTGSGGTAMPDGGERFCVACGTAIDPGVAKCPACGTHQDGESDDDDDGGGGGPDTGTEVLDRGDEGSSKDSGSIGERAGSAAGEPATGGTAGGGGPTATAATKSPAEGKEYCPECGTTIDRAATTCPHCGADRSAPDKNPIIAGVLSLLLVGAGQVYIGRTKRGILLFGASLVSGALTLVTGVTAILSVGIWLYAGYDAYTGAKSE